jgi:DNA-binding CsgD family transcriptional regulator
LQGAGTAFDRSEHAVLELLIEHYEDVPLKTLRIDDLHAALSRSDGASWQALALLNTNMRAYSHYDAGRYAMCLELSTAAARACEERGLAYARNYALFFCGLCHLALANLDEATRCWREAEDCAVFGLHRLDLHRHQTMIRIFSAQSRWEAGGPSLSVQELDSLEAALEDQFDGWPMVFTVFFSVAPEMRASLTGVAEGLTVLERGLAVAHENDWKRVSLQLRARAVLLCLQFGEIDAARERLAVLRQQFDAQYAASPRDEYAPDCRAEELVWIAQAWIALAEGDVARGMAESERTVRRLQSRRSTLNLRLATRLHEFARAATARTHGRSDCVDAGCSRSIARLSTLAAALGITMSHGHANTRPEPAPARALRSSLARLSPRERTIVELIASGYCVKEISRSLQLSVQTVAYYRKESYGKLGVSKRSEVCQLLHADNLSH